MDENGDDTEDERHSYKEEPRDDNDRMAGPVEPPIDLRQQALTRSERVGFPNHEIPPGEVILQPAGVSRQGSRIVDMAHAMRHTRRTHARLCVRDQLAMAME